MIPSEHQDREVRVDAPPGDGQPWVNLPMTLEPTVERRQVQIVNRSGFHMRPVEQFVILANKYGCEVRIRFKGNEFNGKSMLDLLTMAAEFGSILELETRGTDAAEAIDALAKVVAAIIDEPETPPASGSGPGRVS